LTTEASRHGVAAEGVVQQDGVRRRAWLHSGAAVTSAGYCFRPGAAFDLCVGALATIQHSDGAGASLRFATS